MAPGPTGSKTYSGELRVMRRQALELEWTAANGRGPQPPGSPSRPGWPCKLRGAPRPANLAETAAGVIDTFSLLDIREIAGRSGEDFASVLPLYFTISERYDVDQLLLRITALPRGDRWAALARQALRSDLYGVIAALTARVIRSTNPVMDPLARIEAWEGAHQAGLGRARSTLEEISRQEDTDLASLSVALRVLRNLVAQGGTSNADRPADS